MNRRQRNAVFALYRTLLRRRWHRLGPATRGFGAFLVAISAAAAGCAFLLALSLGIFLLPNASPAGVLMAWDGILVAFLFFRVWGIVRDQRLDDVLSMQNFLHLPLAPSDRRERCRGTRNASSKQSTRRWTEHGRTTSCDP